MTGEQRLLLALEMSDFARELASQRIRQEHPDWSPDLIARELIRIAFLPAPLPARLR
jgi:Rv0078B-related antitoxin